jgi:hypothetical protein
MTVQSLGDGQQKKSSGHDSKTQVAHDWKTQAMADSDGDDLPAEAESQIPHDEFLDDLSPAERNYNEKEYSKRVLFSMCIGLKTPTGNPLVDLSMAPWSTLKKKKLIKPSLKDLIEEIGRRSTVEGHPRCANWQQKRCKDWLEKNPIIEDEDVEFLKRETNRFLTTIEEAGAECQEAQPGGSWRGSIPYLRLIQCLTEDDIKPKFLQRANALSRQELDAHNSEQREPSAYELISDRWNCETFNPVIAVSTVHEDFREPIDCSYEKVKNLLPATAEKVKNCISSLRAELLRIVTKWEASGQGDSGYHASDGEDSESVPGRLLEPEHPSFGKLANRSAGALSSRASFLRGQPSYLLILWEVADTHQLLSTCLQRLDDSVSAVDAHSTPSVITTYRGGPSPTGTDRSEGKDLTHALDSFANNFSAKMEHGETAREKLRLIGVEVQSNASRLNMLRDLKREYRQKEFFASNQVEKDFFHAEIDSIVEEIEICMVEQRRLERARHGIL